MADPFIQGLICVHWLSSIQWTISLPSHYTYHISHWLKNSGEDNQFLTSTIDIWSKGQEHFTFISFPLFTQLLSISRSLTDNLLFFFCFHRQQPQQLRWQQRRRQSQSLTSFDADNDDDSGQLLRCGDCEKKLQCEKIDSFSSIDSDNFSGVASRLRRRSGVARLMAEKASWAWRWRRHAETNSG